MSHIADNLARVREQMSGACRRAGRDPRGVRLIAVTKGFDASVAIEAIEAGAEDVGENRVQEARDKWPTLRGRATLHLIGALQTNKAARAVEIFDVIHSIDSARLAEAVNRRAETVGKMQRVLLEVNTSGDATKHGVPVDALAELVEAVARCPHLAVDGLMTIGPLGGGEHGARRSFATLRELLPQARDGLPGASLSELSMGMSGDFEIAIEEGATMVRVGSAIFGPRAARQA